MCLHRGLFLSYHTLRALWPEHVNPSVFSQAFPKSQGASCPGEVGRTAVHAEPSGPSKFQCTGSRPHQPLFPDSAWSCPSRSGMARGGMQRQLKGHFSLRSRAELVKLLPVPGTAFSLYSWASSWGIGASSGRVAPATGEKVKPQAECRGSEPEPFSLG